MVLSLRRIGPVIMQRRPTHPSEPPAHPRSGGGSHCIDRHSARRARALVAARVVRDGAALYERAVHLPRLIPVCTGFDLSDRGTDTARICQALARALRSERNRGWAGHWTYDLNRHIGLLQAFRAERARLARETRTDRRGASRLCGAAD